MDLGNIGLELNLPSQLGPVVINLIRYALNTLSLLTVLMIIIGGFMWLTSGGNEDRLMLAKRTISGAIVGLVIVILSYAIVNFVIAGIQNAAE